MMSSGSVTHEPLAAHAFGQYRHPAAIEDARHRDAAPAVVAGRRPDRAMGEGIELTRDHPRHQAAVGGQDLVGMDHWKGVGGQDHDAGVDSGERRRQLDELGRHAEAALVNRVVPMDAEEIERVGRIGIDVGEPLADGVGDRSRIGELGETGQEDPVVAKATDTVVVDVLVDDLRFESESGHQ